MAKTQNPFTGRMSGKFGNAVFTTVFGVNVIKTKPVEVANPNTAKQQDQRVALSAVVSIYRALSGIIATSFKQLAVGMSAYNAFTSKAKLQAFTYSGDGNPVFNPLNLLVSKGTITPTAADTKEIEIPAKSVTVTFPSAVADASQSLTDRCLIVVYNKTKDWWFSQITSAARSTGTASATFTGDVAVSDDCYVYHAFVNAEGSKSSDSQVESVTPAS